MKIDDFLGKSLTTDAEMTRKSKTTSKPKSGAKVQAPTEKVQKPAERVDSYEPSEKNREEVTATAAKPTTDDTPIRRDKVERAKMLVATGAYDNANVMDKIIDRLIETIREA